MKVKEKINLPVDTHVLCVSHRCFVWNTALQGWTGEGGGSAEGRWKGRMGSGRCCTVQLTLQKREKP